MQYDDCKDYIPRSPSGKVKGSEYVNIRSDDVSSGLLQSSDIKQTSVNDSSVLPSALNESFPFSSNSFHADSLMAKSTSSYSYFSPKTRTSIVHITSNSSGSSTVRENSMYIEKQWAMLKEKMLPSSKKQNSEENNKEHVMTTPEIVEEGCEVDFSFIDEPNGIELDDVHAEHSDLLQSKTTSGRNSSSFDSNSDTPRHIFSTSSQASNENSNQLTLNRSDLSVAPLSFSIKENKPENVPRHSFQEMSKNGYSIGPFTPRGSNGNLLFRSFKDEFLADTSRLQVEKSLGSVREPRDKPCTVYQDVQPVKLFDGASRYKEPVSSFESKSNIGTSVSLDNPVLSDIRAKDHDADSSKASESKRYLEMFKKRSKKKLKELNTITSNQVSNYKGDKPLEEIINFINKEVKVSPATLPSKPKKSKKKSHKKESSNVAIDGSSSTEIVGCLQSSEKSDRPKECLKSCDVSSAESDASKPETDSSGLDNSEALTERDSQYHSKEHANESGTLRNSLDDHDQFSVVKKKKKLKTKLVNAANKPNSEKSLSTDSTHSIADSDALDFSPKTQKNKANMTVKAATSPAEHIPQRCRPLQSGDKALNQSGETREDRPPRYDANDFLVKFQLGDARSKQSCETNDATHHRLNAAVAPQTSADVPSKVAPREVKVDTHENRNETSARGPVFSSRSNFYSSFSKSKSAFNLRHAQEFMNSTYQEVIKKKGYILYGQG